MNYQEILSALKNKKDLIAIFPNGDEYPLRVSDDYSVISTGGLTIRYFTVSNDGAPEGIKDVVLKEESPFFKKIENLEEYSLDAAISSGLIPTGKGAGFFIRWDIRETDDVLMRVAQDGMLWTKHRWNSAYLVDVFFREKIYQKFDFEDNCWVVCSEDQFYFWLT